ncbi:MAG: ABC transporter ATP-binding protein [Nitrososphaerales archaeon]
MIEVKNLHKSYTMKSGTLGVIDSINLSIKDKTFISLVGPSGCGKSTLLSMMGGLLVPDSGEILLDGVPLKGTQPDKIAMVFQDASLYPWRNVFKNVEFGMEIRGVAKSERKQRALKYIELVGLKGFESYFPSQISGGMQQRVSVARALCMEPEVLLMDEPFGALDEQTRLKMGADLIRIWQETQKTIVFVTHSLVEASFLSEQVAILSHRPSKVHEVITIDAPRPRDPDSEALVEARRKMWKYISEENLDIIGPQIGDKADIDSQAI